MYKNIDLLAQDTESKNYGAFNYRIQEADFSTSKPKHITKHSFSK